MFPHLKKLVFQIPLSFTPLSKVLESTKTNIDLYPTLKHGWGNIFACTHVWVRGQDVKILAKLYKGQHLVIDRLSKYLIVLTDHRLTKFRTE